VYPVIDDRNLGDGEFL
jgi:hypothetical protein